MNWTRHGAATVHLAVAAGGESLQVGAPPSVHASPVDQDLEYFVIFTHRIAPALLASVLAAGCATTSNKTALSTDSKQKIKTVALVSVPEPEKYPLHPGQLPGGQVLYLFGALGGALLGGIEASRLETATNEFTSSVRPTNPALAQHWNESFLEHLQSKGYQVMLVPPLSMKNDSKEVDCASIAGKFDAVLLSSISSGYAVNSAVEPFVYATVKMLSGNCGETYFSDSFAYSAKSFGKVTHLQRDARFDFPDRDALLSNPQTAREALRTGVGEVAKRAAADL